MKKTALATKSFLAAVVLFGCTACSAIPLNKKTGSLRLSSEPEQHHLQRLARQSGEPAGKWAASSDGGALGQYALLTGADAPAGAEIDPLVMGAASTGNVKQKRCRPRYNPARSILGSTYHSDPNLNIVRRDVPIDLVRRRCDACRNSPKCKAMGNCDFCERFCQPFVDPAAVNTVDVLAKHEEPETVGMSEGLRDPKHGAATVVSTSSRRLEIPLADRGLSEADDRFYTVGSFGPGPPQSLLARLLKIGDSAHLERLIVLAKTAARTEQQRTVENPVVIDTAHVFTLNDGRPSPVAVELHPVGADKDVVELTRRLNHDLDSALENKRQQGGQTHVHLSAQEIDEIITGALKVGSEKLLDAERVGESGPEDVGCKKKKKDQEDSEEYYYPEPVHYGGYYREADSSEEQGFTDRTVAEEMPKSVTSRNGGLGHEPVDDSDDSDTLRKKNKKGKGNKNHHLTDEGADVVGAGQVLHVDHDGEEHSIKSDSHTADAGKFVQPDVEEDDSRESSENDRERHKGKKGKKKGKKHKKGGQNGGYYGGYRDAEDGSEEVGGAAEDANENADPKARSNYEGPMNPQPVAQNQQYHPQQEEYPPAQPQQPQQYQPGPQYHQEESHQHLPPALPNSYQPEEGYAEQGDNYQSEETYYADDSSEEADGYDGPGGGQDYQGLEEEQQYEPRQEEEEGYQQEQGDYEEPHPPSYQQQLHKHEHEYAPGQPQQPPQKADKQYDPQQEPIKPPPYPQAQNPVYNHPAPPVEQGTYVPKKPQYNEEPKMLPSSPQEKTQYPISQGHGMEETPYQEEDESYEEEGRDGPDQQQEIVIPGLNIDDGEYVLGKAPPKPEDQPAKLNSQLADQYSNILRQDLTQGVKLANQTAEAINKRINRIIEESKNMTEKERMAQLDAIESAIDNIEESEDATVGDGNLEQFQARFNKQSKDDEAAAVLENAHGTFKSLTDSRHLAQQIEEPVIGMANVPGEVKTAPFVDPKAMAHQLEVAKMMRGPSPERVGCKHKHDSSEEYYPSGYYRRENEESTRNGHGEVNDGHGEVGTKSPHAKEEDEVGCKKKEKDKESQEYIMVYPQHGRGGYRANEEDADRRVEPAGEGTGGETQGGEDVGCKKKKKDEESEEEIVYVHPPPYAGGYYRETEENSDRKGIVVQPQETVTNEAIEDRIVGLAQPSNGESGPSGPFTDEPVDENADDGLVGCKKKGKKNKDSGEELIYVYPPQPQYNEYGGYRQNEDGSDRRRPLEKVKEVIEEIVRPEAAARAEKDDKSVVQKVSSQPNENATEVPKTLLANFLEGIKQMRSHADMQKVEVVAPTTQPTIAASFGPPLPREFDSGDNGRIIPPPRQQFVRPPPDFGRGNMRHSPIDDNLAMLEAFHNHQNAPRERPFLPISGERVGAAPPPTLHNPAHRPNHHHRVHADMNFGKMIPAEPNSILGSVEGREVNEKTQMFFVGDGIKLPIHVKKQRDGTMHLSIDVGKLCRCNNVTCTNAVEGLANLVPTLEKLNHGTVELEVNEDSFNSALNNLNSMERGGHANPGENGDKSKRSPAQQPVGAQSLDEEPGDGDNAASGELVPVFDNERYDDITPMKRYYSGDLANDLVNLKDNIQKYYENEDRFKEYMGEHPSNKGFFDDFVTKRVDLLTNVLSWMKSIAIDEARSQHHVDE